MSSKQRTYNAKEVAYILDVGIDRAYQLMGRQLPIYLEKRTRVVHEEDLTKFMDSEACRNLPRRSKVHKPAAPAIDQRLQSLARMVEQPTSPVTVPDFMPPAFLPAQPPDIPDKKVSQPPLPTQPELQATEYVIQSRSQGEIDWLARHGITGFTAPRITARDVRGKHLIAHTVPMWLAAEAESVSWVSATGVDFYEASADDLDAARAALNTVTLRYAELPNRRKTNGH